MADIDESAAFIQDINESVERYWEKQVATEREAVKVPWWVLVVALLDSIVAGGIRDNRGHQE